MAAGQGTRMKELAKDKPKHLIEVAGKPFLRHVLRNAKEAGFAEIILVGGHHFDKMQEFVLSVKNEFNITLINQFNVIGKEKYGTAMPVLATRAAVGGGQFACIAGDNLYSPRDLSALRDLDDEYSYLSLLRVDNPEIYGVPILEGDFVKDFVEKPKEFISNWVSISCYKFTPDIFSAIEKIDKSERGEYEITDAISLLAQENKVKARQLLDYWLDFGNPDDIQKVEQFIEEGKLQ